MSSHFWLSEQQFNKISPFLPNKPRGVPRVDDRRFRGLFFVCGAAIVGDVPAEYGPAKTLYNRYKRWSETGVFERVFEALVRKGRDVSTLMIDASHIKTHRIAANGVKKTMPMGAPSARPKAD